MTPSPTPPAAAAATPATVPLLALAAFFSGLAMRLSDPLIPRIASDFSITPGRAGAVVIGFSIAYGLM